MTTVAKPRALPISVGARPDAAWPGPESPRARRAIQLIGLGTVAVTAAYLLWRVLATITPVSAVLGIPLLVLEAWSLASFTLAVVALWNLDRVGPPAEVDQTTARVAVIIPAYDEPHQVLMPTLAAATRMRLASEVIVLDDGHREWLAGTCDELGIEYRTRVGRTGGIGGQLNAVLPTLEADFFVVLDADQVADRDLIGRTLGHFDDPAVALVQTPRDFYNTDSFEHAPRDGGYVTEHSLFDRVMGAGRNRWGSAMWTGGGVVLRSEAVASVGGIAESEHDHGMATTLRLHRRGWRSIQHNEVLARGRAAADAAQYADRRALDCAGDMQVLRTQHVLLGRGLSLGQRISYLTSLTSWFDGWRTLGYLLLPPAALLLSLTPAAGPVALFAALFLTVFVMRQAAMAVLGRGSAPHTEASTFAVLRLAATLGTTFSVVTGRIPAPSASAARDARRVPLLLWAVGLVNLLGLVWAAVTVAGPTPAEYPYPLIAGLAALWTVGNLTVLARAIARIRSPHFGGDRRKAHRIEVEGHVFVDGLRAHVLDLSLTGARLLCYGPVPEVDSYCAITFTDPNRRAAVVTGTVLGIHRRPHGHELRVGFEEDQTYVLGAILADALIPRA